MGWLDNGSTARNLLTWLLVGIVAIVAIRVALWALKFAWALGAFLLVTVVPIVLVGWLALLIVRYLRRDAV